MRGMEMMLATVLQQMGVDPIALKEAAQKSVNELQSKVNAIDAKLERILEVTQISEARLHRLETKFNTLPIDEIVSDAKANGVLLTDGKPNSHSNGNDYSN